MGPRDPTVGLCLGPYDAPRGGAVSYERTVWHHKWLEATREAEERPPPQRDAQVALRCHVALPEEGQA